MKFSHIMAVLAGGVLASTTLAVGVAGADPKGDPFEVDCGELGTFEIVTPPGNGDWTPGLVRNGRGVLVPYGFEFTGSFTPTNGEPIPFDETIMKNAPKNGRHVVCTFSDSGTDSEGTFTLTGTVYGTYNGALANGK